ncbi:MAG: hypothetical protein R3300_14205, partial [Candidatus Promineifilaceae bacterium]|nr:hypothetical protein [Candidatus Promineifilaceae bacterium]
MDNVLSLIQQVWADIQAGRLPQLGAWNYLVLSILIIWQGPIATLLGGAAAAAGLLQPGLVFLSGVIGNLTADILWYGVGRRGDAERLFGEQGRLRGHRKLFYRMSSA